MIILNSYSAARDLFDKNSPFFSGRPYVPVFELYVPHAFVTTVGMTPHDNLGSDGNMLPLFFNTEVYCVRIEG